MSSARRAFRRLVSDAVTGRHRPASPLPAIGEVTAQTAADITGILLDDLLDRLRHTPGAEDLLLGASVYRDFVDTNALLFQVGQRDEAAAHVPDRAAAGQAPDGP